MVVALDGGGMNSEPIENSNGLSINAIKTELVHYGINVVSVLVAFRLGIFQIRWIKLDDIFGGKFGAA